MRHMRYINIVPCIYRYILRDQTRLSSILLCFCLSFWLMMRLTMVVKWWHATIMPPSSVPSSYSTSCILYKIPDFQVNCGDGGVATSAGVDYTGS